MPFFYGRVLLSIVLVSTKKVHEITMKIEVLQESVRFLCVNENTSNNNHYHLYVGL